MRPTNSRLKLAAVLALGASLAACASKPGALSVEGACGAFDRPEFEIAGRTKYDQHWIDGQIEGGVGACQWERPKPRPASLDKPVAKAPSAAPAKPKRPRLRDRLRRLIAH